MCQECADGHHASAEAQTACDGCQEGSVFVAKDVGCQRCSPGTFLNSASMTACSPCDAGSYQNEAGQSGCFRCGAVVDPDGPNPHLWTTITSSN